MAYSRYQYETSPRKIQPEYETKRKKIQKNNTSNNKKQSKSVKQISKMKILLYLFVGFGILFAICYRNSQITETFNKKENLKKELSAIQKENEQLKIGIENTLNLNTVEQLAKEKLGMQKLNNKQKIYVSLDKKDYIEQATEEVVIDENTSIWNKIIDGISNLLKK